MPLVKRQQQIVCWLYICFNYISNFYAQETLNTHTQKTQAQTLGRRGRGRRGESVHNVYKKRQLRIVRRTQETGESEKRNSFQNDCQWMVIRLTIIALAPMRGIGSNVINMSKSNFTSEPSFNNNKNATVWPPIAHSTIPSASRGYIPNEFLKYTTCSLKIFLLWNRLMHILRII